MEGATNLQGPRYYKRGRIDVWDFIRDQGLNFHLGNAIKYITRAGYKKDKADDLRKAIHYLQNELEHTINHSDSTVRRIQEVLQDPELDLYFRKDKAEVSDRRGI